MDDLNVQGSHSATVKLELRIGDSNFELAEIGPDSVYLRNPTSQPPCNAEVVMHIDGRRRVWNVHLPDGLSKESPLARTRLI
jgi:hypothetical protein